MPNQPPASVPPSGVPGASGGGSGPYVAIAVVFAVVLGGLLCWKYKQSSEPAPPPVASAPPPASETVARPHLDAPPPPPEDTPVPETSVSGKKPSAPGGGGGGLCSSPCTGTASGGMKSDISTRAGNARGCYERALRANPNLQGRMTLNVRVDSLGGICSAGISNDSVGSGEVQACVLGMFRGQKVTAPSGGCVDVSVPLNFQPKNK